RRKQDLTNHRRKVLQREGHQIVGHLVVAQRYTAEKTTHDQVVSVTREIVQNVEAGQVERIRSNRMECFPLEDPLDTPWAIKPAGGRVYNIVCQSSEYQTPYAPAANGSRDGDAGSGHGA